VKIASYIGVDSAQPILFEDAKVPMSKSELIEKQGWNVIDLNVDKKILLAGTAFESS
jgi:hypothetical protein